MTWVELAGLPGSGKTTLTAPLKTILTRNGFYVFSAEEAVQCCLTRSSMVRSFTQVFNPALRNRVLRGLYQYGIAPAAQAGFRRKHLQLIRLAQKSANTRNWLPSWHNQLIFALFLQVAGQYQFLSSHLQHDEVVLLDEGLSQRAVNLYAWGCGKFDPQPVQDYFQHLPAVDLVVIVRAPIEVSLDRAKSRGLPIRLRDKTPEDIQRFMHRSEKIIDIGCDVLSSKGHLVIQFWNDLPMEENVAHIAQRLKEVGFPLEPARKR